MAELALGGYVVFLLVTFGWRTWLQYRWTGDTGLRGLPSTAGWGEWIAGILFVAGGLAGFVAPAAQLLGAVSPVAALDSGAGHAAGLILIGLGLLVTFAAQLQMGVSWRVGVDPGERTPLVTAGVFRLARNPIFTGMLAALAGMALMVPNPIAIAALACTFVGLELQVRWVEEPHLRRVHGEAYLAYAREVGRFVPGVGRLG